MTTGFYRAAAIASFLSALTTLALIFLPDYFAPADGFAGRMSRVADPVYQLRAWIYLFHPFLVFTAALAVALANRRAAPGRALLAGMAFWLWAATEAGQQCLTLFAFDDWRRAWLDGDAGVRASMEFRTAIYDGIWEAMYGLLLLGFLAGNLLLASILLPRRDLLSRIVGIFFALASLLTAFIVSSEVGGPSLPAPLAEWAYPLIQPLGRALVGLWLLRVASRSEAGLQARA